MAERSFKQEVDKLQLGAGEEFRGEGILAVTKALLQSGVSYVSGLPGRADLAPDRRAGRRQRHPAGARRPLRGERQRGRRRRDARRLGQLSAARRRDLQVHGRHQRRLRRARQPGVQRRHRRRADHRRRGLRRRLLDHAGAQPRLRDEVADLAARSAPEPAVDRAGGGERLRAVGSLQHAGDAGAAHPRLPRLRQLHRARQCAAGLHAQGRAGEPGARHQPHRAAAGELPARAGEDREALAGRGALRPGAQAQRILRRRRRRHRHRHAGRHVQHRAARARGARASPTCSARAASRSTCSTSPIR